MREVGLRRRLCLGVKQCSPASGRCSCGPFSVVRSPKLAGPRMAAASRTEAKGDAVCGAGAHDGRGVGEARLPSVRLVGMNTSLLAAAKLLGTKAVFSVQPRPKLDDFAGSSGPKVGSHPGLIRRRGGLSPNLAPFQVKDTGFADSLVISSSDRKSGGTCLAASSGGKRCTSFRH